MSITKTELKLALETYQYAQRTETGKSQNTSQRNRILKAGRSKQSDSFPHVSHTNPSIILLSLTLINTLCFLPSIHHPCWPVQVITLCDDSFVALISLIKVVSYNLVLCRDLVILLWLYLTLAIETAHVCSTTISMTDPVCCNTCKRSHTPLYSQRMTPRSKRLFLFFSALLLSVLAKPVDLALTPLHLYVK